MIRIVSRKVGGVRCRFVYNDTALNIDIEPNLADLKSADTLSILRFWVLIGEWVKSVGVRNPGWPIPMKSTL